MCYFALATLMAAQLVTGVFFMDDDGKSVTIREEDSPVLVYRYAPGKKPVFVPERYIRACYIHPLYGLDGEVMTQDFPLDHFHHRGVFWAWPDSTLGERKADVWALDGIRPVHSKWLERKVDADGAELAMENHWVYDDAPKKPVLKEHVRITIHPSGQDTRNIDFELQFKNVSDELCTLRGSGTDNKGYGGFCLRPDASRAPFQFTSKQGKSPEDVLELDSPWVDIAYATAPNSETISGTAIFQHPHNPGYPHPGWILRHYGFLGQSWPHRKPYVLHPGDAVTLRYRLYVHRGNAEDARVEKAYHAYAQGFGMK